MLACFLPILLVAQAGNEPAIPLFKAYKGEPGIITKYNRFNYLMIRDAEDHNTRQASGNYWEITYSYDSVFRQKKKFRDFVVNQIVENNGILYYQDTLEIHFGIPRDGGNLWGRAVFNNDRLYRVRLIRETTFHEPVVFDKEPRLKYDPYVEEIVLPPRITYLPDSYVARATYSKYHFYTMSYSENDTLYRHQLQGPYWDLKIQIRKPDGTINQQVSIVEVFESYFRATIKAKGKVLKSFARELLFTLSYDDATIWCRVTASIDGTYFVRVVQQSNLEEHQVKKLAQKNAEPEDSLNIR